MFGDEIAIRAPDARPRRGESGRGDARRDGLRDRRARPEERDEIVRMIQETAHEWAVHNFSSGLRGGRHARAAARLRPRRPRGARLHVRALERQGLPDPRERRGDPARRCASCTSATTWRRSAASSRPSAPSRPRATAATAPTTRRSPTCSSRTDAAGSTGSREIEPWDAVLALEPEPHRMLEGDELDDALTVAADFIDLKSPYMGGHSRRCAQLAADAGRRARARRRRGHDAPPGGARARLRHHRRAELDLGQAGRAHADGVRSRRAAPDADRADAAPLAGARGAQPGRVRRTTRSATDRATTSACAPTPAISARACWPRRRSTSG